MFSLGTVRCPQLCLQVTEFGLVHPLRSCAERIEILLEVLPQSQITAIRQTVTAKCCEACPDPRDNGKKRQQLPHKQHIQYQIEVRVLPRHIRTNVEQIEVKADI